MEGKVYYRIKTPNGFLDTHYETIEETQKNLENFKKENGDTEPLHMTRVIEFEEELCSDDFLGNNYDTPDLQPANVTQKEYEDLKRRLEHFSESYHECTEEKERLEVSLEGTYNIETDWQVDYGKLAFYTVYLENKNLLNIIKSNLLGSNIPEEHKDIDLEFYREAVKKWKNEES